MKTLVIIIVILVSLFVGYSELYIRLHSKLRISSRVILILFGSILMMAEMLHIMIAGLLVVKLFSKDYTLLYPAKEVITIDSYDRKTKSIFFVKNNEEYMLEIPSKEINVDYNATDTSTAIFYDAEYRVWIYSIDTSVCNISLSINELPGGE